MSTLVYTVGYDPDQEVTIIHFQNEGEPLLTVKLPEQEVNRLIRLLEAAIDKQESVIN